MPSHNSPSFSCGTLGKWIAPPRCTVMVSQGKLPVTPTLCNCDTVWKEAAFFLLCLVSAFGSIAKITQKSKTQSKHTHIVKFLFVVERFSIKYFVRLFFFYAYQSWCSSQKVQPSVCWRISGRGPPPSHSEDLCSCPASLWCCTAPTTHTSQLSFLYQIFNVTSTSARSNLRERGVAFKAYLHDRHSQVKENVQMLACRCSRCFSHLIFCQSTVSFNLTDSCFNCRAIQFTLRSVSFLVVITSNRISLMFCGHFAAELF